jgi:MFS family permease
MEHNDTYHSALSDVHALSDPLMRGDPLHVAIPVSRKERRARLRLLMGSYIILFLRYTIATFLSSFFTSVAPGSDFSGSWNGLIFAAYPLGMAITSVFAPLVIMRIGTCVSVFVGLLATSGLTVAFGLVPDLLPHWREHADASNYDWLPPMEAIFFTTYFLNGLVGSLAETACLILVSAKFQNNSGAVMASVNTVCTVGCMLGPVVGGVLYSLPKDDVWAFRLPFIVCGAIPLAMLPFVPFLIPQEYISGKPGDTPPTQDQPDASGAGSVNGSVSVNGTGTAVAAHEVKTLPLTASVGFGLASIALSGTIVGTLDPTLQWRLSAAPFRFQPDGVSLFFFYSSVVYVLTATPIGRLVDKAKPSSRLYKFITATGFFVLFLSFFLLAPFRPSAFYNFRHSKGVDDLFEDKLNNLPCTAIAVGIKGIGSALSNVAIYPDLVLNLPDNPVLQATVTAWWNAAYAIGWAAGPILGGVLYDVFASNELCLGKFALPPYCPPASLDGTTLTLAADAELPPLATIPIFRSSYEARVLARTAAPAANQTSDCSCDWQPSNGFDGFASATAAVALIYTLALMLAVACNLRNPEPKDDNDLQTVAPLRAVE